MDHFLRTQRFLGGQRLLQQAGSVGVLLVLFGAWAVWLSRGQVSLYVVSSQARLEATELPVPVQAPVDGQVTLTNVHLGRVVAAGDVIVKLDTKPFELRRAELTVALQTGETSLEALRAQLAAEQEVREAVAQIAAQSKRTSAARISLDETNLEFKKKESEIAQRLREASVLSALDVLHTEAGTATQRAQTFATAAQAALDASTSKMSLRDRDARLATVKITLAQAEAEVAKWKAQTDTLDYEIERRSVRATSAGTLVDVMPISVGMMIASSERIATILPESPVRVVAFFAPEESVGRVRAGQSATLRFDNFPWAQFGTTRAVVEQVGREPRDGAIRVELAIKEVNPLIPMEHGLTARCEVEVERTTPLKLLLRSATQVATPNRSPASGTDGPVGATPIANAHSVRTSAESSGP